MNIYHIYAAVLTAIYTDIHSSLEVTIAEYIPSIGTIYSAILGERYTSGISMRFV